MKNFSSKHYARALFSVGKKQNIFNQLYADLQNVNDTLDRNLDLKKYLTDPHIALAKKKKALQIVFQDFISDKTYNFIFLLIKDKKLNFLNQIINLVKKEYLSSEEIFEVIVETVVPLSAEQQRKLNKILTKKLNQKILLANIINKELIGGIKLSVEDKVIDLSLSARLNRLRSKINAYEQ